MGCALLGGSAAAAPPALLGAPPLVRVFGQWILACDNSRVCRAQAKSHEGSLMIRRDPGPDGRLLVVLNGQDPGEPAVADPASLRVAGARAVPAAPWRRGADGESALVEGDAALRFVRAVADAPSLSYAAGGERLKVPLAGLKAALLAIDAQQGRIGGETAFVRTGPAPRSRVAAAVTVPTVRAVPAPAPLPRAEAFAAAVRRAAGAALARAECDGGPRRFDSAFPLSAGENLVLLSCNFGPTHVSYLPLRVRRGDPARAVPIALPAPPRSKDDHADDSGVYTNLEWDAEAATLTSLGWSCAHLCGENTSWTFDGRDFVLSHHLIYEPGGAEALELYRTNVRTGAR